MALKQISKDIYDVSAWVDEQLGMAGTPERMAHEEKAWEEYQARILVDARKEAKITQSELAQRIGADKSYISRVERGLTIPTMTTFFKIISALGFTIELQPIPARR